MKLSARAVILGLVGVAVVVFVVTWSELVSSAGMIGALQLPPVVLALLFGLVLANRAVSRWGKRLALDAQELAVVHLMMLLGAMIASRGLMERLFPTLIAQNYYADTGNKWISLYFPQIKRWLVPWDPAGPEKQWVAVRFYEGLRSWESLPWVKWLAPTLSWSLLVVALFFGYLCLAVILRKQWAENERLSFPLAQLPLELIRDGGASFVGNRLFWIGFAIPAVIFTLNGLHNWFPTYPEVMLQLNLKRLLTERPWSGVSYFTLYFSPAAVGLFFMLPTDILFSLWFFYGLGKLQEATLIQLGFEPEPFAHVDAHLPVAAQGCGAWFALTAYLALVSWPHLKRVWQAARTGDRSYSEGELFSYRFAVFGLVGAFLFIVAWCTAAGMSPGVAAFEFGVFFLVICVVVARSTSEGGVPMAEGVFSPFDLFTGVMDTGGLGRGNLAMLGFLDAMITDNLRAILFTGFLDGQRVGRGVGLSRRGLLFVLALGVGAAMLMAGALQLWLPYHRGGIGMDPWAYRWNPVAYFRDYAPSMQGSVPPKYHYLGWMGLGVIVTAFLGFMRMRFYWWPFHPLAYALAPSWTLINFWAPILVAWLCKLSISRYGGMRAYQRARPFFLGLVFGEFTTAVAWTLVTMATRVPGPVFSW